MPAEEPDALDVALTVDVGWDGGGATVVAGFDEVAGGGLPALPAGAVGTVLGCWAVFQVAAVGHAVVATVGDVVPYGVGPGTVARTLVDRQNRVTREQLTSVCLG